MIHLHPNKIVLPVSASPKPGVVFVSWNLGIYNQNLGINLVKKIAEKLERGSLVKVLDVGCGKGMAMNELREDLLKKNLTPKVEIFGIDHHRQGEIHNFKYIEADVQEHIFHEKFDLIISHQTLQYIPKKLEVISKIYKWLAWGGEAYLYLPKDVIWIKTRGGTISFEKMLEEERVKTEILSYHEAVLKLKKDSFVPSISFPLVFKEAIQTPRRFFISIY